MSLTDLLTPVGRAAVIAQLDLPGFEFPQCHDDGTYDYYCPRRWAMVRGVPTVPEDALALLPDDEADRVRRHMHRHTVGRKVAA